MYRLLIVLIAGFKTIHATDYCSSTLCSSESPHIACGHSGKFDESCPADAEMVLLTPELKDTLLNAHNTKRNFIAGGDDPNHSKACRMATMQWDDEMASLAALNVKQCQLKHDNCRNTDTFKYSGQNLAWICYYDSINHQSMLEWAVQLWYDEVKDCNMTYINKYPKNYNGSTIGHFAIGVVDKNIKMGCAVATYTVPGQSYKAYLLACNYATTNMVDFPIYDACSTAGSECSTGTNSVFPNLCSINENYAVNSWYYDVI